MWESYRKHPYQCGAYARGYVLVRHDLHPQGSSDELHIPIYCVDAHTAWQRGTNENSNKLLRECFAEGSNLATVTTDSPDCYEDLPTEMPTLAIGR